MVTFCISMMIYNMDLDHLGLYLAYCFFSPSAPLAYCEDAKTLQFLQPILTVAQSRDNSLLEINEATFVTLSD